MVMKGCVIFMNINGVKINRKNYYNYCNDCSCGRYPSAEESWYGFVVFIVKYKLYCSKCKKVVTAWSCKKVLKKWNEGKYDT